MRSYPDFRFEGAAFLCVTDGTGKPVYHFANLANVGAGDVAPIRRATVILIDSQGRFVQRLTDQNGRYLLKFKTTNFRSPYIEKIVDASGRVLSSAIPYTVASNKVVWANVNPLTEKIVSGSLSPDVSGTENSFTGAAINPVNRWPSTGKFGWAPGIAAESSCVGLILTQQPDPPRSFVSSSHRLACRGARLVCSGRWQTPTRQPAPTHRTTRAASTTRAG